MTRAGLRAAAAGLVRACHPAPVVAVTAFSAVLAVVAGDGAGTSTLLALAVLAGQLSIGWSNDRLDAARDRRVGRADKPLATGAVSPRVVDAATVVALAALVALSCTLGWRAAVLNLATVASGWAYNLGLKATWLSAVPYAFSFGALPAVATLAAPGHPGPAAWAVAAGALLGLAAHLTNVLPDLADDRETGVVGLPHRLGAPASLAASAALVAGASLVVVTGPPGPPSALRWAGLAVAVAALLVTVPAWLRRPGSRLPFGGLIAAVGIDVVLLAAGGHLH
ncbi:MAG TPA: UbiA family prenyltransferase [Mycobacteriales bacterium]